MTRYLTAITLCFVALSAHASQFVSATNLECRDGKATLARHWDTVFADGFEQGLTHWQVENYEDNLKLAIAADQPQEGAGALLITWAKGTDTAWGLTSAPLKVSGDAPFELHLWLRSNKPLGMTMGHKDTYESRVEWQDAAGKRLATTPIVFGEANEQWHEQVIAGTAPAGATIAVIRFGFDQPNLVGEEYLALDAVRLLQRTEQSGYEARGKFVSRPLLLDGRGRCGLTLSAAQQPPNSQLTLQVRVAPDKGGYPGAWSDFFGPTGPGSVFTAKGGSFALPSAGKVWLQYVASFVSGEKQGTPSLAGVKFNIGQTSVQDDAYIGVDHVCPVVSDFAPTRTPDPNAPLTFGLSDDGVGYDPSSVRFWLDGSLTLPDRKPDGTYRLSTPLQPPPLTTAFEAWRLRNFQNALTIKPAAARTPDGAPSLLVTRNAAETDTAFTLTSPEIPVAAGEKYTLSFWLRTNAAVETADGRGAGLIWFDGASKPLGAPVPLSFGRSSTDWHELRQELVAPEGAQGATVSLGWDTPNLAKGAFAQFADVQLLGPRPNRLNAAPNLHRVRIEATDYAGNKLATTRYVLVKEPPRSGVVTIRDDGVTLIDGQPFFPIGLYSVSKLPVNDHSFDKAFAELKAAGFNLAHTYNSTRNTDFAEFVAAARKYDFKLFIAPESGNNNPDANAALATVVRECNDVPVVAWYLADDTASWIGAKELQGVSDAIMQVDPYHMTIQADGITGVNDERYLRYVDATTGFLPEIYPIREKTGNHVSDVIRGMKNVQTAWAKAGRVTPVWAIIQDFEGWGWQRYPTNAEERCMVYLALIHGAQGMTWYTYSYRLPDKHGAAYDPQVWAYLKGIATELSSLSEVLTSRDPRERPVGQITSGPQKDALDYPSLNLRLKQWQGQWYLLAANSSEEPLTARLTLPGLKPEVEVLFEGGRKLTPQAGTLEDTFAPLAVHVYRW